VLANLLSPCKANLVFPSRGQLEKERDINPNSEISANILNQEDSLGSKLANEVGRNKFTVSVFFHEQITKLLETLSSQR